MKTALLTLLFKIICVSMVVYGRTHDNADLFITGNIGFIISWPAFFLAYKRLKKLERGRL